MLNKIRFHNYQVKTHKQKRNVFLLWCVRLFAKPDKTRLRFVILSASRKSDAIADDADLGLAKTRNCPTNFVGPPLLFCYARKDGEYPKTKNHYSSTEL